MICKEYSICKEIQGLVCPTKNQQMLPELSLFFERSGVSELPNSAECYMDVKIRVKGVCR